MEHYRVAVGISQPFRILSRAKRRSMSQSARSVPGTLSSGCERKTSVRRSPSAPPVPHPKGASWHRSGSQFGIRPHSSAEKTKLGARVEDARGVTLEVPTSEKLGSRIASKPTSAISV